MGTCFSEATLGSSSVQRLFTDPIIATTPSCSSFSAGQGLLRIPFVVAGFDPIQPQRFWLLDRSSNAGFLLVGGSDAAALRRYDPIRYSGPSCAAFRPAYSGETAPMTIMATFSLLIRDRRTIPKGSPFSVRS